MEATKKFFFYSLFGSLFLFITLILLYYKIGSTNNEILQYNFIQNYSNNFSITKIINEDYYIILLLWFSILLPLIIKIPIFPFHSWLPLAHAEANTIGSILLAAILLKIGSYGIFRYIIELFNNINIINLYLDKNIIINNYLFPIIIILSTISIIYSSFSTIRQIDIKRIIAYSSIVHMNYSIISLFTLEYKSLIGGALLIISHALVSSGLFLLIGILYIRYSTRIYFYYQHLVNFMPLFTTMFFLLILNLISIPFSSSFISELLMLSGILKSNILICIILCILLILNTFYSIWLFNRLSFGLSSNLQSNIKYFNQINPESESEWKLINNNIRLVPPTIIKENCREIEYIYKWKDISINEFLCLLPFIFFSFFFGFFPNSILNSLSLSILRLLS